MRKHLKKFIPKSLISLRRKSIDQYTLLLLYRMDYKRFKKSAFGLNKKQSFENLRAQINFHSHSIEKGLSHDDLRFKFGERAIRGLFLSLEEFSKKEYSKDETRFQMGLSTLDEYIKIHEDNGIEVENVKRKYKNLTSNTSNNSGGVLNLKKEEILKDRNEKFDVFSHARVSVRDFSKEPVDIELVEQAIDISMKTPSACNRQPWKVMIIQDLNLIKDVLANQRGLRGNGENLSTILMVTVDNRYFNKSNERNQGFIDGGMFAMALLYGLEHVGLATCPLNASLDFTSEKNIRKILNINTNENIILFIAVGNYTDTIKIPKSQRDHYQQIITYK